MIGAQKGRGLLWGLDRSKSTKNEDLSGRPKEEVIYEAFNKGMKKFFENMESWEADRRASEVITRAKDTYLAIGYFGEAGYDPNKPYLFQLPTGKHVDTLWNIYEYYLSNRNVNILDEKEYYGIEGDGTDAGQLLTAIKSAINQIKSVAESTRLRVWTIILTDGCWNKIYGETLRVDNVYTKLAELKNDMVASIGELHRAVIVLIYGRGVAIEDDSDICPARAALIADRLSEIAEPIVKELMELEQQGILTRDDEEIFDYEVPVRGGKVRDYAVWRIKDLAKLAEVVFKTTTGG